MYRTESLVRYFPRLAFLNFIFNFILSCFFLYLKVYANEAECKQWHHERFAYTLQFLCLKNSSLVQTQDDTKMISNHKKHLNLNRTVSSYPLFFTQRSASIISPLDSLTPLFLVLPPPPPPQPLLGRSFSYLIAYLYLKSVPYFTFPAIAPPLLGISFFYLIQSL